MRSVDPAKATDVFKKQRRVLSIECVVDTARLFAGTVGSDRREKHLFLKMDSPSKASDLRSCDDFAPSTNADRISDRLRTGLYAKLAQLNLKFYLTFTGIYVHQHAQSLHPKVRYRRKSFHCCAVLQLFFSRGCWG
jgi:hypothetical protein